MTDRNIVLVGFMGCGKSMTSNKLAVILNRKVISTDVLIEKKEGRSIMEIFQNSGEDYFRKIESDIVQEISNHKGMIFDCGGGVVLNPENVALLKKNGFIIYLSASAESIYENIVNRQNRPLLNVGDPKTKIIELLNKRKSYYEQADITVDADYKSIDQIAKDVLEVLPNE